MIIKNPVIFANIYEYESLKSLILVLYRQMINHQNNMQHLAKWNELGTRARERGTTMARRRLHTAALNVPTPRSPRCLWTTPSHQTYLCLLHLPEMDWTQARNQVFITPQFYGLYNFITALHEMRTLSSDENSVRLSNVWIVTKRKRNQSRFLHHTKDHLV